MWLGVRHGPWVWGIGVPIRFRAGLLEPGLAHVERLG